MALTRVDTGLQSFPDFSRNQQLANAQIYIGVPDLDPSVLANQYQAYVVQENGTQVAVPQPIRTSAGGIPTYNGSPVQIAVSETAYSVKVLSATGSQIYYQPNNTDLALIDAAQVSYTPAGAGAVATTQKEFNDRSIHLFNFLSQSQIADVVSGSGLTNISAAFQNALDYCSTKLVNLNLGFGVIRLQDKINLNGLPVTIIGQILGVPQQGSQRPGTTLRWHGGASEMFLMSTSGWRMVGFAAENATTAVDFMRVIGGQRLYLEDLYFLVGSGASRFSRSIFRSDGNNLGYSRFVRNHCLGAAPSFIDIDGMGSGNGLTPVHIYDGLFESNSLGPMTIFKMIDENLDTLTIKGNTFNQQENELCIVDTSQGLPLNPTITNLIVEDNEFDTANSISTDRYFKLTNVKNANINKNTGNGGGVVTALATLVNTTVSSFEGNYFERVAGPIFSADATSRVRYGINMFNTANTAGIINDITENFGRSLFSVSDKLETQISTTSTTYVDTGLELTLSPHNQSDKVRIKASINGLATTTSTTTIQLALVRNGVVISEFEKEALFSGAVTTELAVGGVSLDFIDIPLTVAPLTYKIQYKKSGGAGPVFISTSNGRSSIVAEVVTAQ